MIAVLLQYGEIKAGSRWPLRRALDKESRDTVRNALTLATKGLGETEPLKRLLRPD